MEFINNPNITSQVQQSSSSAPHNMANSNVNASTSDNAGSYADLMPPPPSYTDSMPTPMPPPPLVMPERNICLEEQHPHFIALLYRLNYNDMMSRQADRQLFSQMMFTQQTNHNSGAILYQLTVENTYLKQILAEKEREITELKAARDSSVDATKGVASPNDKITNTPSSSGSPPVVVTANAQGKPILLRKVVVSTQQQQMLQQQVQQQQLRQSKKVPVAKTARTNIANSLPGFRAIGEENEGNYQAPLNYTLGYMNATATSKEDSSALSEIIENVNQKVYSNKKHLASTIDSLKNRLLENHCFVTNTLAPETVARASGNNPTGSNPATGKEGVEEPSSPFKILNTVSLQSNNATTNQIALNTRGSKRKLSGSGNINKDGTNNNHDSNNSNISGGVSAPKLPHQS